MMVTNNDSIAQELRGFINHGECMGQRLGLNLRMTEVTAAMAFVQLGQADNIIRDRIELAHELSDMVDDFWAPPVEEGKHVFYHWAVRIPKNRDAVCAFLMSEGIPMRPGYVQPIYHIPALNSWQINCHNAEKAHRELMIFEICTWDPDSQQRKEMREIFKRASEFSTM